MIRTILTALFLGIFFLISLPMYVLLPQIAKGNPQLAARMAQGMVTWAMRVILAISGARVEVRGLERVPRDRAVLYIGNHSSYFDILVTYTNLPGITGYAAKQEIDRIMLLRKWMPLLHGVTFDRKDPRSGMRMIMTLIDQVKEGYSAFIFPEGTRSRDGKVHEFKAGSFKVATRTNAPIVPVAISGTADIFENHIPFIRPSQVTVTFLDPIDPETLDREGKAKLAETVRERIVETIGAEQGAAGVYNMTARSEADQADTAVTE